MTIIDLAVSTVLILLILIGIAVYALRVTRHGRLHFDRVEKQGESLLMNQSAMTMGFWWFTPVGQWCVQKGISANQVSWISLMCGFVAGVYVSIGMFGMAALFMVFAGMLDMVDGMVARMTNTNDPIGVVLDSSLDRYVDFFFLAGLVIFYRENVPLMLLVLLAMLGSFMISYSTAKAEAIGVTPPRGAMRRSERMVYLTGAAIFTPVSMAYIEENWFAGQAIGLPMVLVVGLIAILSNISAINRLKAVAHALKIRESQTQNA